MLKGGGATGEISTSPQVFEKRWLEGRGAVPGRAPSGAFTSEPRSALGGDLTPGSRGETGEKVFAEAEASGHFAGTLPQFTRTASWMPAGVWGTPGMCRIGTRAELFSVAAKAGDSDTPLQKARRFMPKPLGDGKGSGMELASASKLSLESEQPRRTQECSCWRAPRTEKDRSRGY